MIPRVPISQPAGCGFGRISGTYHLRQDASNIPARWGFLLIMTLWSLRCVFRVRPERKKSFRTTVPDRLCRATKTVRIPTDSYNGSGSQRLQLVMITALSAQRGCSVRDRGSPNTWCIKDSTRPASPLITGPKRYFTEVMMRHVGGVTRPKITKGDQQWSHGALLRMEPAP